MITKVNNTVLDLENPSVAGLDMGGNVITSHGTPTNPDDVATKTYVDVIAGGGPAGFLPLAGGTMIGILGMNGNAIVAVPTPVNGGDATNKGYVDSLINSLVDSGQVVNSPSSIQQVVPQNAFPIDNTIPQQSEGTELTALNTTITPINVNNLLKVEFHVVWEHSVPSAVILFALFRDGVADAIAATITSSSDVDYTHYTFYLTAGSLAATTFKLRIGSQGPAGSTTINSSTLYGGTLTSNMTVTEIDITSPVV